MGKRFEIRVDQENNAEDFWAEVAKVSDHRVNSFTDPINKLLRDGYVVVDTWDRDWLLSYFRTLPGWEGGPAYAPHPVVVSEIAATRGDREVWTAELADGDHVEIEGPLADGFSGVVSRLLDSGKGYPRAIKAPGSNQWVTQF